jgi:N-acetyl-gamma-glutamyl-phosphate reductase
VESKVIRVGIVGGTGYTGVELLRILSLHPHVEVTVVTSRSEAGQLVSSIFPNLRGWVDIQFSHPGIDNFKSCDVVFFATPHGVAHQLAEEILSLGIKVIDLSADFRLKDIKTWEHWYGQSHGSPLLVNKAVYGLPEINREEIKGAELIAVPGCYPTAVQLALIPFFHHGLIEAKDIIADCKSGVSGAGRKESLGALMCETSESIMAYSVQGHRHLPEMLQGLNSVSTNEVGLTFVPHLTPMIRGIHATIYAKANQNTSVEILQNLLENYYKDEPFVDVLEHSSSVQTRSVKGSNMCQISVHYHQETQQIILLSAIDNLVKGASGQAVQNMNIMFELPETTGIQQIALMP